MKYPIMWSFIVLLVMTVGCMPSTRKETTITGKVTIDGIPVESGSVSFVPTGEGSDGGGIIRNGEYTAKVTTGEKLVRVLGRKFVGNIENPDPAYGGALIPKYEAATDPVLHDKESTLTVEVKGRKMTFDIALETGKKLGE